jgi:hypothetical protein
MTEFYVSTPNLPDPDYIPKNEGFINGMYAIYRDSLVVLHVDSLGREQGHIIQTNDRLCLRWGESVSIDSEHHLAPVPAVEQDWHDRKIMFNKDNYQAFDTETYREELSDNSSLSMR